MLGPAPAAHSLAAGRGADARPSRMRVAAGAAYAPGTRVACVASPATAASGTARASRRRGRARAVQRGRRRDAAAGDGLAQSRASTAMRRRRRRRRGYAWRVQFVYGNACLIMVDDSCHLVGDDACIEL